MSRLTVDQPLAPLLRELTEVTELQDQQGNLIGYFTPANRENARLYAKAYALFDPEELRRRKELNAGQAGSSLAEIMKRLQALEKKA